MRRYRATCDCGFDRTYTAEGRATNGLAAHTCPEPARLHRRSCRTCGWKGSYPSAKKADWCKRIHSCERRMLIKGARLRGEFRRAMVDRTPKLCTHKQANHQHGTYACYVLDRCRCLPCAKAHHDYEQNRQRQQAYGRWDNYVDAGPARHHVEALMAAGMGMKRMVALGHTSHGQLWKLLYGKKRTHPDGTITRTPSKRLRKDVAERLLSIDLDLAHGAPVDGADTTRRLQALVAIGWSMSELGRRIGMKHPGNVNPIIHGRRRVHKSTAIAVHRLYLELANVRPPETNQSQRISAARSRNYAAEHGWLPPLRINGRVLAGKAVDEPNLLDKATGVAHLDLDLDAAVVERILAGDWRLGASIDERREVVARWIKSGRSLNELGRLTGWKVERYTTATPIAPDEELAS